MANKCENSSLYESLEWCDGRTTLPGIRQRVYFIPKSEIVEWPKLPSIKEAKAMGELATYQGNFVLAADKKWRSLDALDAKSNVTSESQGEKPSRTSLNKSTLKHAGTDEEATGFARQANIDNLVYLVQQRNKKFRVLGSDEFDVDTKASQALGEGYNGEAGTTLEVEATDVCPAPFYPGKIETEDGDISGADGSAWEDAPVE
ncbi:MULTISPECIES: hypothetical protein [Bacteroides]|uniref:hypothetical protein n=1 Tax=Bacteroides TaxID=816 RepID=UPI0009332B3C|nr:MULTISPECIES: hypothetical protein [Bacteroides]MDC7147565.1 hypothetical protein [Bacteroides ovatus]